MKSPVPALQGTGGFGSVYHATWRGKAVAVKCLPNFDSCGASSSQLEALLREIELSSRFNSKRLVRVYGASLRPTSTICLIMELAEGGSLHQRIYDPKRPRMTLVEALQVHILHVSRGLLHIQTNLQLNAQQVLSFHTAANCNSHVLSLHTGCP